MVKRMATDAPFRAGSPALAGGLAAAAHGDADKIASIGSIDRHEWDTLFSGETEGYDLYRTFESVPPAGFRLGALGVRDHGRLVAAAPVFETAYRLDTPFQGRARRLAEWADARLPGLTRLPVMGIGSPLSDNCSLGLAGDLRTADRARALASLVSCLQEAAAARGAAILALKSVGREADRLHDQLIGLGFRRVTSVPVVMLALPFASFEHYLADLPAKTGSYLRRKLRSAASVRIEYRNSAAGIEDQLNGLLAATLSRSTVSYGDFDQLHSSYFRVLLEGLGERARLMLCWKGSELLSFQVFLVGEKRIIANKIGMKYPQAVEHNLYFVNFLKMIEFAIERGIPEIEMGGTCYSAKLLFGGRVETRWLYYRFRAGVANMLTRPLQRFFDFERSDAELTRLRAEGRLGPAAGTRA